MRLGYYLLVLVLVYSCSSSPTKEGAFTAISNANYQIAPKLSDPIKGTSLKNIDLEDIVNYAKPRAEENEIFSRFLRVLDESEDIKIYPRESSYVMCLKWSGYNICDLSSCSGIEYTNTKGELPNPKNLSCPL